MSTSCTTIRIPGPRGAAGADGADGTDGINAYTTLAADFTVPAELAASNATVADTSWIASGQLVYLQGAGYFSASVVDATTVALTNLEDAATSAYQVNVAPGTVIASGNTLSPAGLQGPAGTDGSSGASTDAPYVIYEADGTLTSAFNLGGGGMTTGMLKHTVAAGVSTPATAVDGTDYLSPTTGLEPADIGVSVQGYDALTQAIAALVTVANKMIYTTGVDTVALTDLTAFARTLLDDSDAATARATLGVSGGDYLLYQYQVSSGTESGTWTQAGWQTVPLNTEVSDAGGHGSIAVNTITLATGTYRVRWHVTGYAVDRFQTRLRNTTTGAVVYGGNADAASTDGTTAVSLGEARITISAGTEDLLVEGYCELTNPTNGFGNANSFGGTQVYSSIEFIKE